MSQTNYQVREAELKAPVRNRYFFGKLLDVYHCELEQDYINGKRWLLNRLISGYGVICGLGVEACRDSREVRVLPGVAIDKWGREIIVPQPSRKLEVPLKPREEPPDEEMDPCSDDEQCVHLCICYHECESDPQPVLAGDCETAEVCTPGTVRESYRLAFKPGKAPEIRLDCSVPDLLSGNGINYPALALRVTRDCPAPAADPCIPLAEIGLRRSEDEDEEPKLHVDVTVRPVVYTNDLLFELFLELTSKKQHNARGGKS